MKKWQLLGILILITALAVGCAQKTGSGADPETTGMTEASTIEETAQSAETGEAAGQIEADGPTEEFKPLEDSEFQDPAAETSVATEPADGTQPDPTQKPAQEAETKPVTGNQVPNQPAQEGMGDQSEDSELPNQPDSSEKPVQTTQPAETEPPEKDTVTYEQFNKMTPTQQKAFQETFDSMEDFFDWYNAAKKAYQEKNPSKDIEDGILIPT